MLLPFFFSFAHNTLFSSRALRLLLLLISLTLLLRGRRLRASRIGRRQRSLALTRPHTTVV